MKSGQELSKVRTGVAPLGGAQAGRKYTSDTEFSSHVGGRVIVAAMMNAFLEIWVRRLDKIGFLEEPGNGTGAWLLEREPAVAEHLLTVSIRAWIGARRQIH